MNLKVGQVYFPEVKDDYILKIIHVGKRHVKVQQLETQEIYKHELGGSDGFEDYLESNGYTLRQ